MSTRLVRGFMPTPLARTLPVAPALAAAAAFATAAAYWNADVRFPPPAKILIEGVCRCPIFGPAKVKVLVGSADNLNLHIYFTIQLLKTDWF